VPRAILVKEFGGPRQANNLPKLFNFSKLSNIDQRRTCERLHARFITAHHGI
jgi:hypothetical protein